MACFLFFRERWTLPRRPAGGPMQAHTRLEAFRHGLAELPPGRRRLLIAAFAVSCLLFLAGFLVTGYLWHLARQFPEAPFAQPSRLYGRATQLVPGEPLTVSQIVSELRQAGYRELGKEERTPLRQGTFRRQDNLVEVHLRSFPTPQGKSGGIPLRVEIRNGRIAELSAAGQPAEIASLEPPLLASFYGPDLNERRPVALDELPEHVVRAILAAEDDNFFGHPGISPTGTARALWVNLRGGSVQQGGSTITQQLVKNLYLSRERTIERKVKEALIAVMLEMRYGKRTILEAYLTEVYWGRSGPANVIGLGAAARAWFGKDASELSLAEAATLAAMIRAPSDYSPVKDADKVVDRRNWVIQRMAELGWITPDRARRASSEPLRPAPGGGAAARAVLHPLRGRGGQGALRHRGPAGRGLSALFDARLARAAGGRASRRAGSRHPGGRLGAARALGRASPGRSRLRRSSQWRHPLLGRRTRLRKEPVRPRLAGAAAGRKHVQAGDLRRGLPRSGGQPGHAAARLADPGAGRHDRVAAAEQRPRLSRLGDGAGRPGAEPEHSDGAHGAAGGVAAGHRDREGPGDQRGAGAQSGPRPGRLRGHPLRARAGLLHPGERRHPPVAARPRRGA